LNGMMSVMRRLVGVGEFRIPSEDDGRLSAEDIASIPLETISPLCGSKTSAESETGAFASGCETSADAMLPRTTLGDATSAELGALAGVGEREFRTSAVSLSKSVSIAAVPSLAWPVNFLPIASVPCLLLSRPHAEAASTRIAEAQASTPIYAAAKVSAAIPARVFRGMSAMIFLRRSWKILRPQPVSVCQDFTSILFRSQDYHCSVPRRPAAPTLLCEHRIDRCRRERPRSSR